MNSYIPIKDLFKKDGVFSQVEKSYTYRPSQVDLSERILNAFLSKQNLTIQAPTGIGKTYAYLIPSIITSIQNNSSIVICTSNKLLQKQLIEKDLPDLQRILKDYFKFSYCLIKGKKNYICNRKVEENIKIFSTTIKLTKEEQYQWDDFVFWYEKTKSGEVDDICFEIEEDFLNRNLIIDDDECTSKKCSKYENCFYYKQKKTIKNNNTNIIVINYNILLFDLKLKQMELNAILPNFEHIIFDEAHKLVDIGRDFFSKTISKDSLRRTLTNLIEYYKKSYHEGIFSINELKILETFCKTIREELISFCDYMKKDTLKKKTDNLIFYDPKINFPKKLTDTISKLIIHNSNITDTIQEYTKITESKYNKLEIIGLIEKANKKLLDFIQTIKIDLFKNIIHNENWVNHNFVANVQSPENTQNIKIQIQPIFLGELLNDLIYKSVESKIAISATLSVQNNFNFFEDTTGFKSPGVIYEQCFDLKNQMNVIVDMNSPSYDGEEDSNLEKYLESMANIILEVINQRQGGVLILTTSIATVNGLCSLLRFKQNKYDIISQFDSINKFEIVNKFKKDRGSCLIGTMSLWEGVDVPGNSLNTVFIVKLPFKRKDDPIISALKHKKYDWFMKYSLPLAVLTFKQGVGRLIRNENDTGLVYIADPRVNKKVKYYGDIFLEEFKRNGVTIDFQ